MSRVACTPIVAVTVAVAVAVGLSFCCLILFSRLKRSPFIILYSYFISGLRVHYDLRKAYVRVHVAYTRIVYYVLVPYALYGNGGLFPILYSGTVRRGRCVESRSSRISLFSFSHLTSKQTATRALSVWVYRLYLQ